MQKPQWVYSSQFSDEFLNPQLKSRNLSEKWSDLSMLMHIIKPAIALFNFATYLTINNNVYLESVNHQQIAFRVNPGTYVTNSESTRIMPATQFFFESQKVQERANGLLESISYYSITNHYINIVHGIHVRNDSEATITVMLDGELVVSTQTNDYKIMRTGPGYHYLELYIDSKYGWTAPNLGGRFLSAWIYNETDVPVPMNIIGKEDMLIGDPLTIQNYADEGRDSEEFIWRDSEEFIWEIFWDNSLLKFGINAF